MGKLNEMGELESLRKQLKEAIEKQTALRSQRDQWMYEFSEMKDLYEKERVYVQQCLDGLKNRQEEKWVFGYYDLTGVLHDMEAALFVFYGYDKKLWPERGEYGDATDSAVSSLKFAAAMILANYRYLNRYLPSAPSSVEEQT